MGVDGITISPGYAYERAPDQQHFLNRAKTKQLFRDIFRRGRGGKAWPFIQSTLFLDFLAGNQTYHCTPWGNPTRTVFGWQRPCYLLGEGYAKTFKELMEETDWDAYGTGNYEKCADCMVHSGFEASAVLDAVQPGTRALGKPDDYRLFMQHSKNYRNLYDPATGFMRGRNSDGKWVEPFDPLDWGGAFTEGNAWQWLWSVQQDVAGLIQLMGGRDKFIQKLDTFFTMTSDFKVGGYKELIHEMTEAKLGNMGQYAHINEPVHLLIYLYDYVGQPWKTQKWVHEVMNRLYKPGPDGWLGDEDNGQMSAWYVLTAMGFYPQRPGSRFMVRGSPLPLIAKRTPPRERKDVYCRGVQEWTEQILRAIRNVKRQAARSRVDLPQRDR